MRERQRETRAMETDDEKEVRLERQRERQTEGDVETAEQREERLKIMLERQIGRTAMKTAEQRDITAKVFNIRVFPTYLYW